MFLSIQKTLILLILVSISFACMPHCHICDTDVNTCDSCGAGYIYSPGLNNCLPCPLGHYANSGELSCTPCDPGTYAKDIGSAFCRYCPDGKYSDPEAISCSNCPAGSVPSVLRDLCIACRPGFWAEEGDLSCHRTAEGEAAISSSKGLGATGIVAKSLSSGSSGAFGFGVVAKVVRNARYFSVKYSNKTQSVFAAEESSSFEVNAPAWFEETDSKALHVNFVKYGVEANFLVNFFGNLVPILIISGCFVMFGVLKRLKKKRILANKILVLFQIAAGNYLVNSLYGSFDEIVLYFILEAQTSTFNSVLSWISFACALIFLVVGIGFFGFHFEILKKYQAAKSQKGLEAFKSENAQVKVLFQDFRDDSLAQQSFLASFMIRASLLNILLCLFVNHPLVEACLYLAVNLVFAVFLVVKRPYEEFKGAIAQYFCETIILVTYTMVLILAILDHNGTAVGNLRELLEKIIVVLGIALNIGGTIFQCIDILETCYGVWKEFLAWRARLKVTKAPVGSLAKAVGHAEMTFMKKNTGIVSLKVSPRPASLEADGNGSPTRLFLTNVEIETDRLSIPSTVSTRQCLNILFTGESNSDLDNHNRTSVFANEMRLDHNENILVVGSDNFEKEQGEVFGDLVVFDYEKIHKGKRRK